MYKGKHMRTKTKLFLIKFIPIRSVRHRLRNKLNPKKDVFKELYPNAVIDPTNIISNPEYVKIGNNVCLNGYNEIWANPPGVEIGDNVVFANHIVVMSNSHHYDSNEMVPYDSKGIARPIHIGNNVWIGAHSIILPGVYIDEGAIIAAGSVVTKSVPKCAIVAGNPARIVKYRDIKTYDKLVKEKKFYNFVGPKKAKPEMIIINEYKPFMK